MCIYAYPYKHTDVSEHICGYMYVNAYTNSSTKLLHVMLPSAPNRRPLLAFPLLKAQVGLLKSGSELTEELSKPKEKLLTY